MRLDGYWVEDQSGVRSPVIEVRLAAAGGRVFYHEFLIDTGAECTTLTADMVRDLRLRTRPTDEEYEGLGGPVTCVRASVTLMFETSDDTVYRHVADCYAFTTPNAIDLPILGRDVLDKFALIVDPPRDTLCLLADPHHYALTEA